MRVAQVAVVLTCLLAGLPGARADERAQLLASLRPALRAELTADELSALGELPSYALDVSVRDDLSGYTLHETIELTNTTGAPLPDVSLRLFGNAAPPPAAIRVERAACMDTTCRFTQPAPSVLRLEPAVPFAVGARVRIALELRGELRAIRSDQTDLMNQGLAGLSSLISGEPASDYGLLALGDGIASFAHFYAVVAQRRGSHWISEEQKPFGDVGASEVSWVRATIRAPAEVKIASVGVEDPASRAGAHTLRAALVRDFAFVASRALATRSRQVGDVTVRAHFLPRDADAAASVLDTAAGALADFERRFGLYPYPELDVAEAALVGGAGGCEFSGLVTVASALYRPLSLAAPGGGDSAGASLLGSLGGLPSLLEFTTAHEVAHQYWYGLVGSDAREHPWQDEALTQWSAQLYFEDRFGAARGEREAELQVAMNYHLMRMLGLPDGPVERPVDAFSSPLAYAGLVYGKAAYLYPALRRALGDAAFFAALRSYARRYRFQTAAPQALFELMAQSPGRSGKVRSLVAHWLSQRHGDGDLRGDVAGALGGLLLDSEPAAPAGAARASAAAPTRSGSENVGDLQLDPEQLKAVLQGLQGSGQVPAGMQGMLDALQSAQGELRELEQSEPNVRGLGER